MNADLEQKILAILQDITIGRFAMDDLYAQPKAEAIVRLLREAAAPASVPVEIVGDASPSCQKCGKPMREFSRDGESRWYVCDACAGQPDGPAKGSNHDSVGADFIWVGHRVRRVSNRTPRRV